MEALRILAVASTVISLLNLCSVYAGAAEGKLQGLGPIHIGMTEAETTKLFGTPVTTVNRDNPPERILVYNKSSLKFGGNVWELASIILRDGKARVINMSRGLSSDRKLLESKDHPSTVFMTRDDVPNSCAYAVNGTERIFRIKYGNPNQTGDVFGSVVFRNWVFQDGSTLQVQASYNVLDAENYLCKVTLSLIGPLPPDIAELTVLP